MLAREAVRRLREGEATMKKADAALFEGIDRSNTNVMIALLRVQHDRSLCCGARYRPDLTDAPRKCHDCSRVQPSTPAEMAGALKEIQKTGIWRKKR